jgi:Na+-transporting methylmalonyl-CoA/oxaloacetate decarboxylase gamma subunit
MRILANKNGASSIKVLLVLVLLFLVVHVAVKLVPMYMDYERMKDEMAIKASTAQVWKDEEILVALAQKAKELELPLGQENFVLNRDTDQHTMTISTQWDVEVHFLFDIYVRTFHFSIVANEDYTKARV